MCHVFKHHAIQADALDRADVLILFKSLVNGYPDPPKALATVKGSLTALSIDSSTYAPVEMLATLVTDHSTMQTMTKGPFKNEKVRLAKSIFNKCALMESMLSPAGTHAKFIDDFKVEADTMSAAVNLWQGFREDSEAVRDDDLNQNTAKIKKALADYRAWADIVPDVQLKEKEFMKFIRNGKTGINKGAQLSNNVETAKVNLDKMMQEWNYDMTEELDDLVTQCNMDINNMKAVATINAVISIVRNPAIGSTEGAPLRATLNEVMKEFDSEELLDMCPSSLREDADKILSMKDTKDKGNNDKKGNADPGDEPQQPKASPKWSSRVIKKGPEAEAIDESTKKPPAKKRKTS